MAGISRGLIFLHLRMRGAHGAPLRLVEGRMLGPRIAEQGGARPLSAVAAGGCLEICGGRGAGAGLPRTRADCYEASRKGNVRDTMVPLLLLTRST